MNKIYNLDLQLFAEGTVNATTSPGLSAENKTFYDKVLIQTAEPKLIHDQFAQKRDIPQNGGKKIEFRKYASLPKATEPLVEGVTPDGQTLEVSKIEAEVSQYGGYVTLTDILKLTAIDNNIVEATKAIGNQAGITLDTITRNVMQSGTNVFYCPKSDGTAVTSRAALNATCKLTVAVVKDVATFLKANNAPKIGDSYVAIIHPYVSSDLMDDPEWKYPHQYQDTAEIYEGEIGKIHGVRFVETSEAKIYAGTEDGCPSGLAVFGTLFLADGAYGTTEVTGGGLETIIKQLGSAGTADPLNQRATVGWKALKTAEILVQPYIVRVESCGKYSATAKAN